MTVLIVAMQHDLVSYYRSLDTSSTWKVLQYRHPLKALDNLAEIEPDIILWSQDDFPRHWGAFIGAMGNQEKKARFYLVSEHEFSEETIKKVQTLALEGYSHEGFFSDDVAHFIKKHQGSQVQALGVEIYLPLTDARGMLVQEKNGAFAIHSLELGKNELKAILVDAQYASLPQANMAAELVLIHGTKRMRLDVMVKHFILNTLTLGISGYSEDYAKLLKTVQRH